jgi:hypothetical protein
VSRLKEASGLVCCLLAVTLAATACGEEDAISEATPTERAAPTDWGPCRPDIKIIPLAELKQRVRFRLLLPPTSGPLSRPLKTALAWVRQSYVTLMPPAADPPKRVRLPSRQAVAYYYSLTGKGLTIVLQEAAYSGVEPIHSLMEVMGQGYFYAQEPLGCRSVYERVRGTNVAVNSTELTHEQEHQLVRDLKRSSYSRE